jgi:hypothetical protein
MAGGMLHLSRSKARHHPSIPGISSYPASRGHKRSQQQCLAGTALNEAAPTATMLARICRADKIVKQDAHAHSTVSTLRVGSTNGGSVHATLSAPEDHVGLAAWCMFALAHGHRRSCPQDHATAGRRRAYQQVLRASAPAAAADTEEPATRPHDGDEIYEV